MMLLTDELSNACRSLCNNQNSDGGVDVTRDGDTSGCWTTASALWSIIRSHTVAYSGVVSIKRMTKFLLDTQVATSVGGAWPIMPGGASLSTMATGHAIAALVEAHPVLEGDDTFDSAIRSAVSCGLEWLERSQNEDGGWGPQPTSVGTKNISSVFATYYAMLSFWRTSNLTKTCDSMRIRANQFLLSSVNSDGSWGRDGETGEVSDTARAMISLIQCRGLVDDHKIIKRAARYLLNHQGSKGLWKLGRVELVLPKSSGITVFTNNRSLDALNALSILPLRSRSARVTIRDGLEWLIRTQEASTGTWYLCSKYDPPRRELHTWPSTEWLYTTSSLASAFARIAYEDVSFTDTSPFRKIWLIGLLSITLIIGFMSGLYWKDLSEESRSFILITVVLGITLNIVASIFYSSGARWGHKVLGRWKELR